MVCETTGKQGEDHESVAHGRFVGGLQFARVPSARPTQPQGPPIMAGPHSLLAMRRGLVERRAPLIAQARRPRPLGFRRRQGVRCPAGRSIERILAGLGDPPALRCFADEIVEREATQDGRTQALRTIGCKLPESGPLFVGQRDQGKHASVSKLAPGFIPAFPIVMSLSGSEPAGN